MSELTSKVAYLKGLAEGMNIAAAGDQGKLIGLIIDALGRFATEFERLDDEQQELSDYVESIDGDLSDLEDSLLEDEDDDDLDDDDDEDSEDDDEDESFDDEGFIEIECPSCHHVIYFDTEAFDEKDVHNCPNCGAKLLAQEDDPE